MKHTQLNVRNYSSFALVIFLISSVSVGFGTIDLIMVARKGGIHVAAVGQGDLITIGLVALFVGFVDTFSSRLAMAEGSGQTSRRLPVLTAALLLMVGVCEAAGVLLVIGVKPFLELAHQDPRLIPLVNDFVSVRMYSIGLMIAYAAVSEALKICGLKNVTFSVLCVGFGANALLDWLFLYSGLAAAFSSPEQAVATATVAAQALMTCCSLVIFGWQLRKRHDQFDRPSKDDVVGEFWSMARTAPGVGVRHLNDYMGSIIPMMFVGTIGIQPVAAYAVGAKIYTIFCRVPQACVSATFMYYGYEVGREAPPDRLAKLSRTLLTYAAIPTAVATVLVAGTAPWLVRIFSNGTLDTGLAERMLFAFMITVPLYIFEASYGELLTVHQRGGLLSVTSTLTTWFIMIPLAAYGVFVLHSAVLAIAIGGIASTAVIVYLFRRALRKDHWTPTAEELAEVQVA